LDEVELERTIDIQKLGYEFLDNPVIVGGLAMEFATMMKFSTQQSGAFSREVTTHTVRRQDSFQINQ
jgi:hypothetical protein